MPRKPRIEYDGAVYHLMNRGDQGEKVFNDRLDCENFLATLATNCQRTGWVVHAYVLMPNHFHMLVETPAANLVGGMKWFMSAYTQKFNQRHAVRGHLFQGRYKAVVIEGEGSHLGTVGTYIHLNPARAGLISREGELREYEWSSYRGYVDGKKARGKWLEAGRVLSALGFEDDMEGRREYDRYMSERIRELRTRGGRKMYDEIWKPIRWGWCVGGEAFEREMVGRVRESVAGRKRESYSGEAMSRHDEVSAERWVTAGMKKLGIGEEDLAGMPKNAPEKCVLAWLVGNRTMAPQTWIAQRLKMGAASNVGTYMRDVENTEDSQVLRLRQKVAELGHIV